jgi:hypothetical protein
MKIFAIALLSAFEMELVKDEKPDFDRARWIFQTGPPINGEIRVRYRQRE